MTAGTLPARSWSTARRRCDAPVAEVGPQRQEGPPGRLRRRRDGHRVRATRTPTVSMSTASGGRSLRRPTVTPRMRWSTSRTASATCQRQGLEQGVRAGTRDGGGDHVGHRAVVDGVRQGVGHAGRSQVDVEVEVDLERLGPLLLLGQHPVGADTAQAAQLDAVARPAVARPSGRLGGPGAGLAGHRRQLGGHGDRARARTGPWDAPSGARPRSPPGGPWAAGTTTAGSRRSRPTPGRPVPPGGPGSARRRPGGRATSR